MKKVYIYRGFERFWHWLQSILIIFLVLTGFEIHGSYSLFGFESAVSFHIGAAYLLIILVIFAIFWHFATGEWKQYIPTFSNLKAQAEYYVTGIFRNAPHPTRKTQLSKLNPLQRLVYLGLKLIVIPVMMSTGVLYLMYRFPQDSPIKTIDFGGLATIAVLHTFGAFLLVSFIIAHLYLITTGNTVSSNLQAMITGYEELEEDVHHENVILTDSNSDTNSNQTDDSLKNQ